jgi:hypothetical protein
MFSFLKKLFGFGSTPAPEAPYKVEAPSFVALGEPPATVVVVEGAGAVEVPAPKKKAAPKKPAGEKKPRAKKAPKA